MDALATSSWGISGARLPRCWASASSTLSLAWARSGDGPSSSPATSCATCSIHPSIRSRWSIGTAPLSLHQPVHQAANRADQHPEGPVDEDAEQRSLVGAGNDD